MKTLINDPEKQSCLHNGQVKPFVEIIGCVNADECSLHETERIVIVGEVFLHHSRLVKVQHRVVQILWMAQDSPATTYQLKMTFRNGEFKLKVEQILVGAVKKLLT